MKRRDEDRLNRWSLGAQMGHHPVAAVGVAAFTGAVCAAFGAINGAGTAVIMAILGAMVGAPLGAQLAQSAQETGLLSPRHHRRPH